ncbi:MAG: ankyrin repeat domain-containing protein [Synergistaceae bacterium]|nr:ankyrin repeat domain-containing protein [Synergistaceae bacterium]
MADNKSDINARDKDGATPLMLAARDNAPDVVEALLERGAYINAKDNEGRTALMYAAAYNRDYKVLKVLLEAGASANARDKSGRTPLMHAAEHNANPLVVRDLLKARAFVNARTEGGKTPLAFAALRGNPAPCIVMELLRFGADPDIEVNGRRLKAFAKDSPALRGTRALRALRAAG